MRHDFALLTPERVALSYRLAGAGSRMLAHSLDGVVLVFLTIALATLRGIAASVISDILFAVLLTFSWLLYFVILEVAMNGRTVGKLAAGIRVRMADGTPITPAAAFLRNIIRPADFLPALYFLGTASMLVSPKCQRLGDIVAGTIVVHDHRTRPTFRVQSHHDSIHPFEHLVGDLRGMTKDEYQALKRLVQRLPTLPVPVQMRMLEQIWSPISRRVGVPPIQGIDRVYIMEAVVAKYARTHGLA